jgi:RimJ/RimL family protein N-acetyltransferase
MVGDLQISFRPLALDDLELLQRWLNNDFVARWWPGWPSLEQVRAKYAPRIEGTDPTKCFIIELDGLPTGFIQCYRAVADSPHLRALFDEPEETAGIDLFLGDRAHAYHGLGPRVIRDFLRRVVFAGPPTRRCIIDPAHNNFAAIRAYKKVGFSHIRTIAIPGELQPSYIMAIRPEELPGD